MVHRIAAYIRKYKARRELDRIVRERRESFAIQSYRKNRAAQIARRTKRLSSPESTLSRPIEGVTV